MSQLPDHQRFENAYSEVAPWDIEGPQPAFAAVADKVASPVLDVGCGTGEHAIFFAGRGCRVTGIDFVEEAIRRAKAKAAAKGLSIDFRVGDALALGKSDERFATVLDSGLFHVFADGDRRRYVAGLAHVLQPGGRLFLQCFSELEPGEQGPRRVSEQELRDAFADGWTIESLERVRFALNPKFTAIEFSEGGPKAWFTVIRKE